MEFDKITGNMAIDNYKPILSIHALYDVFPYSFYSDKVDPLSDNQSLFYNVCGFTAVFLTASITPLTVIADIIMGIFESVYLYIRSNFDFDQAASLFYAKCVASPVQQTVVMFIKLCWIFGSGDWVKAYEVSQELTISLPDSVNYKVINIFFDNGHPKIFKAAGLPHPDGKTWTRRGVFHSGIFDHLFDDEYPDPYDGDPYDGDPFDDFHYFFGGFGGFGGFEFESEEDTSFNACIKSIEKLTLVVFENPPKDYTDFRTLARGVAGESALSTEEKALKILGITDSDFNKGTLKKAYHKLSMKMHPDRMKTHIEKATERVAAEQEVTALFQVISTANTVLEKKLGVGGFATAPTSAEAGVSTTSASTSSAARDVAEKRGNLTSALAELARGGLVKLKEAEDDASQEKWQQVYEAKRECALHEQRMNRQPSEAADSAKVILDLTESEVNGATIGEAYDDLLDKIGMDEIQRHKSQAEAPEDFIQEAKRVRAVLDAARALLYAELDAGTL